MLCCSVRVVRASIKNKKETSNMETFSEETLQNYKLALDYLEKSWQLSLNKVRPITAEVASEALKNMLNNIFGNKHNLWNAIDRVYSKIANHKNINKLSCPRITRGAPRINYS